MIATSRELAERLDRVLRGYWGLDETGPDLPAHSRIDWKVLTDCVVAHVPASSGKPEAFLKLLRSEEMLRSELQGLRLGNTTASPRVAVPKVMYVDVDANAMLIEYIQGSTLGQVLRSSLLQPFKQKSDRWIWQDLGAWLEEFHSSAREDQSSASELGWPDFVAQQAAQVESLLRELRHTLATDHLRRLEQVTRVVLRTASAEDVPLAYCHGDFALNNLILTPGRVWVLDFACVAWGPRELDLETLRNSLEDVLGFLPGGESLLRQIYRDVLTGYGRDYSENQAVADLMYLGLRLQKLYYLSHHVPRSRVRRAWRSYQFGHALNRLVGWADRRLAG